VPIRALLGELYLAAGMTNEALAEFEAADEVMPNRFRIINGEAESARANGSVEAAKRYYQALMGLARGGDGERKEISAAKTYLAQTEWLASDHNPGASPDEDRSPDLFLCDRACLIA
jgi:hypothetical protein